jgi:hypothetical protein
MQNAKWQIHGLDTAWDDDGLKDPQAQWVNDLTGAAGGRKLMLLSHHQLFSTHEQSADRGRVLKDKLGFLLGRPALRGWFWGHEHRCAVYQEHAGVPHASCIGHGGVPFYMNLDRAAQVTPPSKYEYRDAVTKGLERWGLMGYSVLDFNDDTVAVTYIDENGIPHFEDVIR